MFEERYKGNLYEETIKKWQKSKEPNDMGLAEEKLDNLKFICQWILEALKIMHEHGLIHCDVKPGEVKINSLVVFNPDKVALCQHWN